MLEFGFSVVGWGGVLFVGGGYLLGGGVGWGVVFVFVSGCCFWLFFGRGQTFGGKFGVLV